MMPFVFIAIVLAAVVVLVVIVLRQNARIEELLRAAGDQIKADQSRSLQGGQALEDVVRALDEKLKNYQDVLARWEADRAQKFGRIEQELGNAAQSTLRLQETTSRLTGILANVKQRGQWGERMAEDIIRHAGLLENVNYSKQTAQADSLRRPDFTFFLPNGNTVNMDVKFPLDNYLKMANAGSDIERALARKDFFRNVRDRIRELRQRDYVNPAENTLDFVLLFIPNEQVFAMVQEEEPGIMDEALKDKVVLCSPFTLYAVLAVIRQAHEHFRFEKDLKKIIQLIDQFARYYETFKNRFEAVGTAIDGLGKVYSDVREKSYRNLEAKIRHIDEFRKGHMPELVSDSSSAVEEG